MLGGVAALTKLIIRRDRIKLPLWTLAIVGLLVAMVPMLRDLYGSEEELSVLFQTFGANPAGLFITGPMDQPSFGGLMTIETIIWWGVAIALLNTFFIVRHTRLNEESGAQEVILSAPVARGSGLVSAGIVALFLNTLIAAIIGISYSFYHDLWSTEQAWLYGISFGAFGLLWAGIAAVVSQLVESARTANGILGSLLGLSFILRGIGDFLGTAQPNGSISPHWISFLSPLGWLQQVRPLTYPEWWPVCLMLAVALVCFAVAYRLVQSRDVGSGILPARSGSKRANKLLRTLSGLALYLQKNIFLAYLFGVLILVGTVGALITEMVDIYDSSDEINSLIVAMGGEGGFVESFLTAMLTMAILVVIGYVINALERMKNEETSGRLENLLAVGVGRSRWLMSHLVIILIAAALMLAIAGGVMALAVNLSSDLNVDTLTYVMAGLSYLPLVGLIIGDYVALFGLLPRVVGVVVWAYFGFMVFITWTGPVLQLDQWVMHLSLLEHISSAPVEAVDYTVSIVMLALSLILLVIGFISWRRRDLV